MSCKGRSDQSFPNREVEVDGWMKGERGRSGTRHVFGVQSHLLADRQGCNLTVIMEVGGLVVELRR